MKTSKVVGLLGVYTFKMPRQCYSGFIICSPLKKKKEEEEGVTLKGTQSTVGLSQKVPEVLHHLSNGKVSSQNPEERIMQQNQFKNTPTSKGRYQ